MKDFRVDMETVRAVLSAWDYEDDDDRDLRDECLEALNRLELLLQRRADMWPKEFHAEAMRAYERYGPQTNLTDAEWLSICLEELAECGRVLNDDITGAVPASIGHLREELVQTGAMVLRWLWVLDARGLRRERET